MEPGKKWFIAKEITGLPDLPTTLQGVGKKAKRENWKKRKSRSIGGGWEYYISSLPEKTQAFLYIKDRSKPVKSQLNEPGKNYQSEDNNSESLWNLWEQVPESARIKAEQRLSAVKVVDGLVCNDIGKLASYACVATEFGISTSTIRQWWKKVKDLPKCDWLPALLPKWSGSNNVASISIEAWDFFKGDYLRLEAPTLSACYERLKRTAIKNGWLIPSKDTFKRKLKKEIPEPAIILARQGEKALERTYPSQERDHSYYHSMQAVNGDGHKIDVFVRFPDGEICRAILHVIQDVRSGKILSYRIDKTENFDAYRLAILDMVKLYGIPEHFFLDNGRALAAKKMTGGIPTRFRFKNKEDEPLGILTILGIQIHWCFPYHGQSKPIERAFRDFCEYISKHPKFSGAYTGNNPQAKPENYGSRAVSFDNFKKIVFEEINFHNERHNRRSKICQRRSFDEVFNESYRKSKIRKATAEQIRILLLAAESVTVQKQDGAVYLGKNRYYCEQLFQYIGKKIVLRFDPEKLHDCVYAYELSGKYIGKADCIMPAGFGDTKAAREHNRARNQYKKAMKKVLKAERRMNALEVAEQLPGADPANIPVPKIVKPEFVSPHKKFENAAESFAKAMSSDGIKEQLRKSRQAANDY